MEVKLFAQRLKSFFISAVMGAIGLPAILSSLLLLKSADDITSWAISTALFGAAIGALGYLMKVGIVGLGGVAYRVQTSIFPNIFAGFVLMLTIVHDFPHDQMGYVTLVGMILGLIVSLAQTILIRSFGIKMVLSQEDLQD